MMINKNEQSNLDIVCAYKAIVYLNNTGVNLLSRQQYKLATDTFKDAIRLMRCSFFQTDIFPSKEDFHQSIQAARTRSFNTSSQQTLVTTDTSPEIVVITDQASPYKVYEILEQDPKTLFAIRIEDLEDSCCYIIQDRERIENESAILLYNYGIAHKLAFHLTATSTTSDETGSILKVAFDVLKMAQGVTARLFNEYPEDSFVSSQVLTVSLLTTTALLSLSTRFHTEDRYRYKEELADILEVLSDQFVQCSDNYVVTAAAAA